MVYDDKCLSKYDMQVHRDILISLADNMHSYGYSRTGMLMRAGIDLEKDVNALEMVDSEKGIRLWNEIFTLTKYPPIGLSFGKNLTFSNLSWIAGLTQTSATLLDAWKSFCEFSLLMGDMFFYKLEENADQIIIEYIPNDLWVQQDSFSATLACDHAMSLTLLMSAYLCGQSIKPLKAECKYNRELKYHKHYKDIYTEINFNSKSNKIYFDRQTANMKVLSANKMIYEHMYEFCLNKLKMIENKEKISNRVKILLNQKNSFYTPKIEEVSSMLNMSARTLQRKLKEESVTFQDIVEEVKIEQAKNLLSQGQSSMKEIAFLVGYSSVQSFSRSFKNHVGVTPGSIKGM